MSARPDSIPVKVLKVNADRFVEKIISGATFLPYVRRDQSGTLFAAGKVDAEAGLSDTPH